MTKHLEDITVAMENLTEGIDNTAIAQLISSSIINILSGNPFDEMRREYELKSNGFWIKKLGILKPFTYAGEELDPRETLNSFFDTGDKLYELVTKELVAALRYLIGKSGDEYPVPSGEFRALLAEELDLTQDIAKWAVYLSQKKGIIGSRIGSIVRKEFKELGIENPESLPKDINIIRENILSLYDKVVDIAELAVFAYTLEN